MTRPLTRIHSATPVGEPAFAFLETDGPRIAGPEVRALPQGTSETLSERMAEALKTLPRDGLIGGALPFDRSALDIFWASDTSATSRRPGGLMPVALGLSAEPAASAYAAAVERALERMALSTRLEKVVLARSLALDCATEIDRAALLEALSGDPSATAFDVRLPGDTPRHLIGATPELLLRKSGAEISSHPLAGSARRSRDPVADRAAADSLSGSPKDRREHAFVVEAILDTLAPLCRTLSAPEGTTVTSTGSMWHLGTKIIGKLSDPETPAPVLAALLHPTPAVCGTPRPEAAQLIADLEPRDRGYYAGAVGWCDAQGDGAWYVAIRCAEVCGTQARLFAGAGIVPGSDPAAEAAETGSKFAAMLEAFGLPRDAALTLTE